MYVETLFFFLNEGESVSTRNIKAKKKEVGIPEQGTTAHTPSPHWLFTEERWGGGNRANKAY